MPLRWKYVPRECSQWLVLLVCAWTAPVAVAEEGFPYTARVSGTDVRVRSGPGKDYYVTQELQYGDQVEVFRHDPGGWYAVRPPRGSFSWVAARYLNPHDDQSATVTGQRVVARVGSQFSEARDVIQIRLDEGERVRVLDAQRLVNGATAQTWYKIAPPAGEFRWIYGKYLQKELPPAVSFAADTAGNLLVEKLDAQSQRADRRDDLPDRRPVRLAGREQVEWDARGRRMHGDTDRDAEARESSGWSAAKRPSSGPSRLGSTPSGERSPIDYRPENPNAELQSAAELDLILSSIVIEDPSRWDFTELRAEAEGLLSAGRTAVERGRARLVLKKIDRFDDIRRRYAEVRQPNHDTPLGDRQPETIAATRVAPLDTTQGRHDARGRLTRVVSRKLGAPRYALLSSTGEVLSYVTPSPGVNLRPYIGQQVGITGSRGYMAEYERQHVTAQRITVLDRPLAR